MAKPEHPGFAKVALQALRPKQWTKNGLLFAALIFSQRFVEPELWLKASIGFAAFCLVSSSGYLYNDLRDKEADQRHPKKRLRPIASGSLSVKAAKVGIGLSFVLGIALGASISPAFLAILSLYFCTTLSYTIYFKHTVILDVMFIAVGFLWRAAAGAIAIDVLISPWLLVCTGFLALFLGFNKRRGEHVALGSSADKHRVNLHAYSPELVIEFQAITTSGTIISYALYTVLASPTPWLLITLPYVLYGLFRYIYLVQVQGEGGAPEETLLKDQPILVTCTLYIITCIAVLMIYG